MFPNMLREPPSQFKVGFPDKFPPGQVEEKFKAQFGVWIVNTEYNGQQQIYALKIGLHAPGLHAELAGSGAEIQMPLPRQRLLQGRHQFRRPGPAAAGAVRDPHRQTTARSKSTRAARSRKKWGSGTTRPVSSRCRVGAGSRASGVTEVSKCRPWQAACGLLRPIVRFHTTQVRLKTRQQNNMPGLGEIDSRIADLEEHLPASDAGRPPQSDRGDADQLLPAPAPGVDQEAGHRAVATPGAWAA